MNWSNQQETALIRVKKWLSTSEEQVFHLFGYAGTGKTTLAKEIAGLAKGKVVFAAYTGKAAHVLTQKGCAAKTIHQLIYLPKEPDKRKLTELHLELAKEKEADNKEAADKLELLIEDEKRNLSEPKFIKNRAAFDDETKLIIIDECSMVDKIVGSDLLSFGIQILVLGDPAQLPPIKGGGFFTNNNNPEMMLTEIHRQAKGNPIIDLATMARHGKTPSLGHYGNSTVLPACQFPDWLAMNDADMFLAGKNITRRELNAIYRKSKLGRESVLPQPGDKLVCLKNNHKLGLLNGALWDVEDVGPPFDDEFPMKVSSEIGTVDLMAWSKIFQDIKLEWWEHQMQIEQFDFGYVLTVHKSQGSQWDKVVLLDESKIFRNNWNRWLYTGITRASKEIIIVV